MQNLEPFSGWMRVVLVMMMMMITNSRKQRKSSLSHWDENTASLIMEPNKRTVIALFKNHEAIASRCVFSIIQSINKRRRTWRVWLQLEVCEIKYQKWYYLPVISSAAHSHMALWCRHQQKAVIGLYLPKPVPNIIRFSNNAQKHFQTRACERTRHHNELLMICKCARLINCDWVHLPRWRVCTFIFRFVIIIIILLMLHLCVCGSWACINQTGRFHPIKMLLSKEPIAALFSHH